MSYFNNCKTVEEIKKEFHRLCVKLHPDNGGSEAEFKAMKAEYEEAFKDLENGTGAESQNKTPETPQEFAGIVETLIFMEGVKIEIIGTWIWLTGNTYFYKDQIKQFGFIWSKSKKAWYHKGRARGIRARPDK